MSLAPQELENSASKYAAEAIRLDSQGSRGMAIQAYQRAIEVLVKLVQIYPDYKLNKVYMERANAYQNRIKALQMSHGLEEQRPAPIQIDNSKQEPSNGHDSSKPSTTSSSSSSSSFSSSKPAKVEQLKADFDDLVMKEKPNVSWNEVIGLEDAKRAIRESIVYPMKRADLFRLAGRVESCSTARQGAARHCWLQQPRQKSTAISSTSTPLR